MVSKGYVREVYDHVYRSVISERFDIAAAAVRYCCVFLNWYDRGGFNGVRGAALQNNDSASETPVRLNRGPPRPRPRRRYLYFPVAPMAIDMGIP